MQQEFLRLLNDYQKNPARTLIEWQKQINHILNNLTNGEYVSTSAVNVLLSDFGNYYLTDNAEAAFAQIGARMFQITTLTDTASIDNTNYGLVICNKATAMTVNLPSIVGNTGLRYGIVNIGAGTVTLDPNLGETIVGDPTFDLYTDESITIFASAIEWREGGL